MGLGNIIFPPTIHANTNVLLKSQFAHIETCCLTNLCGFLVRKSQLI